MPRSIRNSEGWTIRKLLQNTFHHKRNRFENKERDVLKSITIKKISVYDAKDLGQDRTKFIIQTSSYPQYAPYYTGKDVRGRPITKQRTYKHQYDITIQMDSLSIDDDRIKLRTGADAKWDFSEKGKGHWEGKGRNRKFIEGSNIKRGLNGDFFFRLSWVYSENGILFGRNYANGPPKITNPKGIVFLDKHMIRALQVLIDKGVLK
jgi:hypothetical protein